MKPKLVGILSLFFCAAANAGTFLTATIDGDFSDWSGVPVLAADSVDNAAATDFANVQVGNDENFLYITVSYHGAFSRPTYISMDVDSNVSTGFDVFSLSLAGTEASWQNDFPFAQTVGVFNNGFGLSSAATISAFVDAPQVEWAIPLNTTFNETGAPVFADDEFTIFIWTDQGVGDVVSPIAYTLATVPEPSGAALVLMAAALVTVRRRRS